MTTLSDDIRALALGRQPRLFFTLPISVAEAFLTYHDDVAWWSIDYRTFLLIVAEALEG